jgi:VWFA-related protein
MRFTRKMVAVLGVAAGVAGLAGLDVLWGQTTIDQTAVNSSAAGASGTASASGAASPQQAAAATSGTTIRVTSREIVLDVTATDDKGRPVRGLQQSDFTVKEDGKPQTVRSFREVGADTAPEAPARQLPPHVYTNLQPAPTTSAVNIILLDTLNAPAAADQLVIRQESIKYLKSMPKGTRVAVLGLSSSLRILQGFTADPSILIAAVNSKKNSSLPSPFTDTDTGGVLEDQADAQTELGNDDVAAQVTQFENEQAVQQQDMINRMTLEALNQIAAYVSGIKGRKNLIWFTDGIPLSMTPSGGVNDLQGITDYQMDLRRTTDLLTAAEVAVYPVDARKLFSNPSGGADQHLSNITVRTAAKESVNSIAFAQKKGQEQLSMEAVAEATGGAAYYNTNDLKTAVAKAIDNGANYYNISYSPPDLAYDGKYHAINVTVARPGVHLAYRKGYNNDDIQHDSITPALPLTTTAPEPYQSNMVASMGRGVPTASQVLFSVRVEPDTEEAQLPVKGTIDPKLANKPLVRYGIRYSVPSRQFTFSEAPDGTRKCAIELDVAAYDVYGKRITGLSQTVNSLPLTAEQYRQFSQRTFQPFQQIDLPAGEIFLRIGVLDGVANKVGTLEIPLIVKKTKPAGTTGSTGGNGGK